MTDADSGTDRPKRRVVDSDPEPGYFKKRVCSHGPWIPARIYRTCCCTVGGGDEHQWTPECDRSPLMLAQVMGFPPTSHQSSIADIYGYWHDADYEEYLALLDEAAWNGED